MIGFAADFLEKCFDFRVARDVTWKEWRFLSESCRQFLDVLFQPFALVIENETRARGRPGLRDCPGDTALIRDTEDNSNLSFQHWLRHTRSTILRR